MRSTPGDISRFTALLGFYAVHTSTFIDEALGAGHSNIFAALKFFEISDF